MFALLSQAQGLRVVPGALRIQELWGPNDDTYDTTDYYM
jgi:hypothetical protein